MAYFLKRQFVANDSLKLNKGISTSLIKQNIIANYQILVNDSFARFIKRIETN